MGRWFGRFRETETGGVVGEDGVGDAGLSAAFEGLVDVDDGGGVHVGEDRPWS